MFSENQFSAVSTLHPSERFPLHDGDILSEFCVCVCVLGEMERSQKCSYPLFSLLFDFGTALPILSSLWGVMPTGACRRVTRAFLGLLGPEQALTQWEHSTYLMERPD